MTLLIGANLDLYTIVWADTRTTSYYPVIGPIHQDGDHKIIVSNAGLLTGSGNKDVLDFVKQEFLSKDFLHTNDILDFMKKEVIPMIEDFQIRYPYMNIITCFLLSYITTLNNETKLRLALIHPQWDYDMGFYDDSIVIMPHDASEESARIHNETLRQSLIKLDNRISTQASDDEYIGFLLGSIISNVKIIAKHFTQISQESSCVSHDLDIVRHILNGSLIYFYGKSCDIMKGIVKFSIIPVARQFRVFSPAIFDEGETIEI